MEAELDTLCQFTGAEDEMIRAYERPREDDVSNASADSRNTIYAGDSGIATEYTCVAAKPARGVPVVAYNKKRSGHSVRKLHAIALPHTHISGEELDLDICRCSCHTR